MGVFAKNGVPGYNGLSYNYHEWFLFSGLFDAGMFGCIFLGCYLICLILRKCWADKKKQIINQNYQQQDMSQIENGVNPNHEKTQISEILIENKYIQIQDPSRAKASAILSVLEDIFLWIVVLLIFAMLDMLSGFNYIPVELTITLFVLISFGMINYHIYKTSELDSYIPEEQQNCFTNFVQRWKYSLKTHPIVYSLIAVILLFIAFFVPLISQDLCICIYNTGYGIKIGSSGELSSSFSRGYWIDDPYCKRDQICHLYATLPEDASTGVFINVHTGTAITQIIINYVQEGQSTDSKIAQAQLMPLKGIEKRGERHFFTALIQDLRPNTTYYLSLIDQNGNDLNSSTSIRTFPAFTLDKTSTQKITIAFGGDVGYTRQGQNLTASLASIPNLNAIIVGGDVAYDDAMNTCYYSWDTFFSMFDQLQKQTNRLIPLITALGNHDVGFNAFATQSVVPSSKGPYYFVYLPQSTIVVNNETTIPSYEQRGSLHYHRLGNMIHFTLDSGYLNQDYQQQAQWVQNISKLYPEYYKFANYHVPLFPSCWQDGSVMNTPKVRQSGIQYWMPVFKQYKFLGAFENHVHQFKMTKPLYTDEKGQIQDDSKAGTIFFGDGNWGVFEEGCPNSNQYQNLEWSAVFQDVQYGDLSFHVWILEYDYSTQQVNYYAVNPLNQPIPNSNNTQDLNNYKGEL